MIFAHISLTPALVASDRPCIAASSKAAVAAASLQNVCFFDIGDKHLKEWKRHGLAPDTSEKAI